MLAKNLKSITYYLLFFLSLLSYSQDIIRTNKDVIIEAKILEVTSDKVTYKRFDYQEGPTLSIDLSSVRNIIYSNGKEEDLNAFRKQQANSSEFRDADFYVKGIIDAEEMYNASGPIVGSTASTLLFWPAGLVTSIVLSSTKPKPPIKNSINEKFISNSIYNNAYIKEAHKKKKRKVWTGFGVSTAVIIIVGIMAAD